LLFLLPPEALFASLFFLPFLNTPETHYLTIH
jgi:hypothetical protein